MNRRPTRAAARETVTTHMEASQVVETRKRKIAEFRREGKNPYPNGFRPTHTVRELRSLLDAPEGAGVAQETWFRVAGRIMAVNRMGKSCFFRFRDRSGLVQGYIKRDEVGEAAYDTFKRMDIGDFIGVVGPLFQTRTGEWTLLVKEFVLLSKNVRPLPEKFHGLKDPEKRYRQRWIGTGGDDHVHVGR